MSNQDKVLQEVSNAQSYIVNANIETIYGVSIDFYCFKKSKDTLENVYFESGSSLTDINSYAFYECANLQSIDLSPCIKLQTIGRSTFENCKALSSIKLPEGLSYIGIRAFNNIGIQSITIPASVQTIEQYGFANNKQLTSITFKSGSLYSEIKWNTFANDNLLTFEIPESISSMTGVALAGNTNLETITVNSRSTYMKSDGKAVYSFNGIVLYFVVPSLTGTYVIREGIETLNDGCFMGSSLSTINLSSTALTLGGYCFYNSKLQNIYIPDSVYEIGLQCFFNCKELKTIDLPSSLKTLSSRLFYNSGLTVIKIPDGVTTIEDNVFSLCTSLTDVYLPESLKQLGGGVLERSTGKFRFANNSIYYLYNEDLILDKTNKTIYQYIKNEKTVEIPSTITRIKQRSFYLKSNLQKITCNSVCSLQYIESSAFERCYFFSLNSRNS